MTVYICSQGKACIVLFSLLVVVGSPGGRGDNNAYGAPGRQNGSSYGQPGAQVVGGYGQAPNYRANGSAISRSDAAPKVGRHAIGNLHVLLLMLLVCCCSFA